jgi:predicted lipoprotein with Yx(FWY)xxD motif
MTAAGRSENADPGGWEVGRAPVRRTRHVWGRAVAGALSTGGLAAAAFALALVLAAPAASAGATTTTGKTVKISTAKVAGVGTVLTTASGLTLYRFTDDAPGKSMCTGACAKIWPPLLAAKGAHLSTPRGVKGLSLLHIGSHWQVAYHKLPLYRFASDKKKGQAHGQDVGGVWFAVLKSGIPAAAVTPAAGAGAGAGAATSSSTPTTSPGASTTQPPATPTTPTTQGGSSSVTTPPAASTPAAQPPTPAPAPAPAPRPSPPAPTTTTTSPSPGSGGVGF